MVFGTNNNNLPSNLEAERAFLGALLIQAELIGEVAPGLWPAIFFDERHRVIFKAIVDIFERVGDCSRPLLAHELHERGELNQVGGAEYLAGLEDDVFSLRQTAELAEIIKVHWQRRWILARIDEARKSVLDGVDPDEVQQLLAEPLPGAGGKALPRCLPVTEFISVKRPQLDYHIEGILPFGGKLTFSATSKWGKSMWALQTGLALAAGECDWLGWRFGPPARVLYLQAEIMDGLLESRMRWLLDAIPTELNRERAAANFIIQEINDGKPNLATLEGRARVEAVLRLIKPDVLVLDPLASIYVCLEENEASAMGAALDYIHGLTLRFSCSVILIHHHGKAGAARGSSVFEAWPESDLQASFVSDEDRTIAKVVMRLRCAYNPGPVFWKMPTPEHPWFEGMPNGWQPERAGRKPSYSPTIVGIILQAKGNLRWKELKTYVIEATECSERAAERLIAQAKKEGLTIKVAGIYASTRGQS